MGVCHRDMSLENILVDEGQNAVIIDLGMCLRVPYDNGKDVTDVALGTLRRLIKPLVAGGKWMYVSPEILSSAEPFDGFAIDLWATAVILFLMLVGLPPWEFAHAEDPRYRMVIRGGLEQMVSNWDRQISPLAADLLQKMLREDPRQRLSMVEIKDHPWVVSEETIPTIPVATPNEEWRR
jgi:serine/threonine protein kinase